MTVILSNTILLFSAYQLVYACVLLPVKPVGESCRKAGDYHWQSSKPLAHSLCYCICRQVTAKGVVSSRCTSVFCSTAAHWGTFANGVTGVAVSEQLQFAADEEENAWGGMSGATSFIDGVAVPSCPL